MNNFFKKNDVGINIEYTIIGKYELDNVNYVIYTDFTSDENELGIRIYVDQDINGKYIAIPLDKQKEVLNKFNDEISNLKREN